ncbi:MAG TPA: dihydrolipoamide acetyltransferase family protein [Capillimicrobium sp.]
MHEVVMPRLSDSMEEGTIIRWLKEDGDEVARGDEIVEIETDKATMAYEADAAGTLSISVAAGATVPVGAPIAAIGDATAGAGAASSGAGAGASTAAAAAAPPAPAAAPPTAAPPAAPSSAAANGSSGPNGAAAISASPVARRVAARLGVDLAGVVGSGPYGRIVKADVVAAQDGATASAPAPAPAEPAAPAPEPVAAAPAATAAPPAAAAAPAEGVTFEELTRTQQVIARRMAESRATVPDFALEVDVDMTQALQLRTRLKELAEKAPSVNDFVVKAAAVALRRHPRANGSYRDGRFELHAGVHVGVAVAGEDTLVVPVVRDADGKSLGAIAADTRSLAARVRSKEITAPELSGGTFTVSNLGMFGIDRFEGIVNVPQAAILCVGAIRDRVVAVDGQPAVRPIMSMTLACDHRILYGADAARFLDEIRGLLEQPLALAL